MFRYSLKTVLDYKQQIEDVKTEKLLKAIGKLGEAEAELESAQNTYHEILHKSVSGRKSIEHIRQYATYIIKLEEKVKKTRAKVANEQEKVSAARQEVAEAMKERKVLEKLGEKELEKYLEEVKRKEESNLSEAAVIRYARNNKKP